MRVVIASCSVTYQGRGNTSLPRAVRAILIKSDGAVSIHSDLGNKPLNYMGTGNTLTVTRRGRQQIWTFANKKEAIEVKIHSLISDTAFDLDGAEPGLERQNTEHHLQAWIAANPESLGAGWEVLAREYPTGAGAVDILARDPNGQIVAVEVKRTAMLPSVDQAHRYVEALNRSGEYGIVRGLVAALDVRPNTRAQADKRGVTWIEVAPSEWNNPSGR